MDEGNSTMTVALWPVQDPELRDPEMEDLKKRVDALEKRVATL